MKHIATLALAWGCLFSTTVMAQEFLKGQGVFVNGMDGVCVVQTGRANMQGQYAVLCGSYKILVARDAMRSNPDQTETSRRMVCPGGGDPCYFE